MPEVDVINFVTVKETINFGSDSYKPNLVLKAGDYEVIEWSYHNQKSPEYRYDYIDLIHLRTRERIHFMLSHPEKYGNNFIMHSEYINRY